MYKIPNTKSNSIQKGENMKKTLLLSLSLSLSLVFAPR